jgi:hypothetical protein
VRVGEPAGGSLTADEYKFAVTSPWAIIVGFNFLPFSESCRPRLIFPFKIPIIWDRSIKEVESQHKKALQDYEEKKQDWDDEMNEWKKARARGKGKTNVDPPEEPKAPRLRMQRGEEENFLRYSTALKILVGSSIGTQANGLGRAKTLLEDYLLNFSRVRCIRAVQLQKSDGAGRFIAIRCREHETEPPLGRPYS